MSGWVALSFCTMEVASGRGGVHTSSTTSSMPLACSSFSRRGLKKKTVAAVLSPTTAAFRIGWLFRLASSTTRSRACSAWAEETGEVWKVYLNPRSVMLSAYESESHGTCSRSATSVTPSVNDESQEPMPALIFSRVSKRWAALTAFSTLSPASPSRSTILAPPSALMPPWLLISSIAISAPIFLSWPCRAQRPESGATSAILTSSAAGAGRMKSAGATRARARTTIRVRERGRIGCLLQRSGHSVGPGWSPTIPPRSHGTRPRGVLRSSYSKGANHGDEKEGHGAHDGLGGHSGGQGEGVRSLVQRGASGRATLVARVLERRALRGGQGRAEASRRLRAGKRRGAGIRRLQARPHQPDRVDQALLARGHRHHLHP